MHLLRKSLSLLVILSALIMAAAATAGATNVTILPGGSVVGRGTSSWELQLNSSGRTFNCVNAGFTATLRGGTGIITPFAIATNYQQTFSNCTATGGISYNDTCTATASLNAVGATVSGVTPLTITGLSCTISIGGSCTARLTGSLPASFDNATSQLTIPTTGQSITITGSTCTSIIPNGPALFSSATGGAFVYAVTPATTINVV
jgi:hypothetical protein